MKNAWGSQNELNLEQYTVFANQKGVIVLFRKYASLFLFWSIFWMDGDRFQTSLLLVRCQLIEVSTTVF